MGRKAATYEVHIRLSCVQFQEFRMLLIGNFPKQIINLPLIFLDVHHRSRVLDLATVKREPKNFQIDMCVDCQPAFLNKICNTRFCHSIPLDRMTFEYDRQFFRLICRISEKLWALSSPLSRDTENADERDGGRGVSFTLRSSVRSR
jgi:hypothetical protein